MEREEDRGMGRERDGRKRGYREMEARRMVLQCSKATFSLSLSLSFSSLYHYLFI